VRDKFGNIVEIGDRVLIPTIEGKKIPVLATGFVKAMAQKKQFANGGLVPMLQVEYLGMHWMPASKVVKILDNMIAEDRREKLNATEEATQPS
jgi:hypothetical protein